MLFYGILTLNGVLTFVVSGWLYNRYETAFPLKVLSPYLLFELVFAFVLPIALVFGRKDYFLASALVTMCFLTLVSLPNFYVLSQILLDIFNKGVVDGLLFSSLKTPAQAPLGQMRARLYDDDIRGAMRICLETFEAHSNTPDVLFDGARFFFSKGLYPEALALYQRAAETFAINDSTWGEAVWHQALILDECLDRPEEAAMLRRQIIRRMPKSTRGHQAAARIQHHRSQ